MLSPLPESVHLNLDTKVPFFVQSLVEGLRDHLG
jgi:hypothetical protein